MATLHVEFSPVALKSPNGSSIHGKAVYYEAKTISGSAATSSALTVAQAGNAEMVARISTDTACFVAIGTTPDPTATAITGATSAKSFLAANASFTKPLQPGDKVAVIAA